MPERCWAEADFDLRHSRLWWKASQARLENGLYTVTADFNCLKMLYMEEAALLLEQQSRLRMWPFEGKRERLAPISHEYATCCMLIPQLLPWIPKSNIQVHLQ